MRITAFFIALSVFFCYSSVSSTVDTLISEKHFDTPQCHIVSSGHMNSHPESKASKDYKSPDEVALSSCCLNSLVNHKDFECGFMIHQIFTIADYFFQTEAPGWFKSENTYFKKGHGPPDINILNSTFLI